jgi:hypothetical protein
MNTLFGATVKRLIIQWEDALAPPCVTIALFNRESINKYTDSIRNYCIVGTKKKHGLPETFDA